MPDKLPPRVKVPLVVTVPVRVIPFTVPVVPTDVTVPEQVVKPESLLKIDNPISLAAFLLSALASKTMNSSVPTIAAVISVNSDKSTVKVTPPEVPPPLRPTPAVTPVISPVQLVQPESLLKLLNLISEAAFLLSVVPFCRMNSVVPDISPVMSVNSEKSKFKVTAPEEPPPDSPVPAVTPVISPVHVVNPESLLNELKFISDSLVLTVSPAALTPEADTIVPEDTSASPNVKVTAPDAPPPVNPAPAVTPVMSPVQVVNPESLLKIERPISLAAFLLSALASKTINSSVPTMAAVISVNSDKSTVKVTLPDVPPPLRPVPAPTQVISPVQVVYPLGLEAR